MGRTRADRHVERTDDLVGQTVLHHPVLVDPRLVGEGVASDDCLVGLRERADHVGEELAGSEDLARIHGAGKLHRLRAHECRHNDFFEGGVTGSLADPVRSRIRARLYRRRLHPRGVLQQRIAPRREAEQ